VTAPRVPALAVLAVLLVLPGCTHDASAVGTVPARNATTAPSLPTLADALPDMDASGFRVLMGQLRGTPVVVNYWAAWCVPCKAEVPMLVDAHTRVGDRVQFVGVDLQDFRDGARSFLHADGVTYPSVFDPANSIALSYDLFSPPMTQFWDAGGHLVATVRGQISQEALQANLDAIAP
jgi:cytochrome c biogenesis protein CcmG, thiol:disulfide interchange protein DsbE